MSAENFSEIIIHHNYKVKNGVIFQFLLFSKEILGCVEVSIFSRMHVIISVLNKITAISSISLSQKVCRCGCL